MRAFHIPTRRLGAKEPELATPWTDGHASPEDRALGHELELIELERRRAEVADDSPEALDLEREMRLVRQQLAEVAVLPDLPQVA
jgi:hypothetical protein